MAKNPYSVQKANWSTFQSLVDLKTDKNKPALNSTHLRILEYIGSFIPENGCWEDLNNINKKTIRTCSKTFKRYIEYLTIIGALTHKIEKGKPVYRINLPSGSIISQRDFRVNKGMSGYGYALEKKMENASNIPNFFTNSEEKLSQNDGKNFPIEVGKTFPPLGKNFPPDGKNFPTFHRATIKDYQEQYYQKKETTKEPPDPLHSNFDFEGLGSPDAQSASGGTPNIGSPSKEGLSLPISNSLSFLSKTESEGEMTEKFFPTKKEKKHKTGKERRLEAIEKIEAGHIANRLGSPDNRKRQHNAKQARVIGETGAVTNAQLWGHLVRLWDTAFGEGILEQMVSKDKSAIATMFAELQKQFSDVTGFFPENRDLAEYFSWFLEPKRLSSMLSYAKYESKKNCMHIRQLGGAVYIKRFYDEVIARRKNNQTLITPSIAEEMAIELEQIFLEFREKHNDQCGFIIKIAKNGYALAVQYLHDECEMSEEECREYILKAMIYFYKQAPDKEKAIEFFKAGVGSTERKEKLLLSDTCIWYSWKEKIAGLVETAIERAKTV